MTRLFLAIFGLFLVGEAKAQIVEYQIAGDFDGCDYDKLYPLEGGGILECQEYTYFYAYSPTVVARGREVLMIDEERVEAYLHNGSTTDTRIDGDFEGCEFDKAYALENGMVFVCQSFSFSFSFRPEVQIFFVEGRPPVVYIEGEQYRGSLFRR